MIPLKFLSFGEWAPSPVSVRLMLLHANDHRRYATDTHTHGMLCVPRAWSWKAAVRVWAHSEGNAGSSHISAAENEKLC